MQAHTPIPTLTGRLANSEQPLVDARDLHTYLQASSHFKDWIKRRIEQYGFIEGEDFCCSNLSSGENQSLGGRFGNLLAGSNRRDYHLSLEMAKELALVENNVQGRIIRRELIAFERRVRERVPQLEAALANLRRQALAANPLWRDVVRYRELGLSQTEIGLLVGKSADAVRHIVRRMAAVGVIEYRPDPQKALAGHKGKQVQQMRLQAGGKS